MAALQSPSRTSSRIARAIIEIGSILFLFYANLLMGEFTVANGRGKTLAYALADIFTYKNFGIAVISAVLGYSLFQWFRRKV